MCQRDINIKTNLTSKLSLEATSNKKIVLDRQCAYLSLHKTLQ